MFYEGEEEIAYTPYGILTEGIDEVLTVFGKNLYNPEETTSGYIDANGNFVASTAYGHSDLIPVDIGSKYIISGVRNYAGGNKRLHGYDENNNFVQQLTMQSGSGMHVGDPFYFDVVIPSGISKIMLSGIRIDTGNADTFIQIEKSTRPTKYEDYITQIYNMPTLLGLDGFVNTLEITKGEVTRKVGAIIFTGDEYWTRSGDGTNNNRFIVELSFDKTKGDKSLCSHISRIVQSSTIAQSVQPCVRFSNNGTQVAVYPNDSSMTVDTWKAWLLAQYNAGTPFMLVYPYNGATIEDVEISKISVTTGTNIIKRKSDTITGLMIEAGYKKLK